MTTTENLHYEVTLPRDLIEMEALALDVDAALLSLDPLMSRLSSELDTHKDGETLGLIHHNKSGSTDPLQLVMGSKAFTAVARSVSRVVPNPDDDTGHGRLFGTPKNNLGRGDLPALRFTIGNHIVTEEGDAWTGRIEWGGESTENLSEALRRANEPDDVRTATAEAADWLGDYITLHGLDVTSTSPQPAGRSFHTAGVEWGSSRSWGE